MLNVVIGFIQMNKGMLDKLQKNVLTLLSVILVFDLAGIMIAILLSISNVWLYNILDFLTINGWLYIFYKNSYKRKNIILPMMWFFSLISIFIWVSGVQPIDSSLASIGALLGSAVVIIAVFYNLVDLLKSEKVEYLNTVPLFFISIGLMINYVTVIPYTVIFNLMDYKIGQSGSLLILFLIISAIIMYSLTLYSFICKRKAT